MHKVSKSLGLAVSDSEDDVIQIEDTEVNILDPVNTSAEEAPMPKKKSEKKRYEILIALSQFTAIFVKTTNHFFTDSIFQSRLYYIFTIKLFS